MVLHDRTKHGNRTYPWVITKAPYCQSKMRLKVLGSPNSHNDPHPYLTQLPQNNQLIRRSDFPKTWTKKY